MRTPGLLTIEEAAARMCRANVQYSVATLRRWRYTWPDGAKLGPPPLLISPRRLRYREADVDAFIRHATEAASRSPGATVGGS